MRVLITGASGFVGRHLVAHLCQAMPIAELHGTTLSARETAPPGITLHALDLRDRATVTTLMTSLRPDQVYHLAAWAQVRGSFGVAWETLENNVRAQLNVLLACLDAGIAPRILAVSSGEIYGGDQDSTLPTTETAALRPTNPYSVSKATQDLLALQYHLSHGLPIVRARPFNHLGRGQGTGFVAPDFACQIARIELGLQVPVMRVGNLAAERDFTDVRDIVRAYALLMAHGTPGQAYNVASGTTHSVQYVLDTLIGFSTASIAIERDPTLLAQPGVPKTWGDASRLCAETGWSPTIMLADTLAEVLDDCRQRVRETHTAAP